MGLALKHWYITELKQGTSPKGRLVNVHYIYVALFQNKHYCSTLLVNHSTMKEGPSPIEQLKQ